MPQPTITSQTTNETSSCMLVPSQPRSQGLLPGLASKPGKRLWERGWFLVHKQDTWQKKGDTTFDVTMGSYDGAETCELVGSFLLSQLQHLDVKIGLYRDDGLAVCNATPRETENIKKEVCRVFNQNGLRITIEANKQIINFLDVTFNLNNSTYKPFTKPNTTLQYVHRGSNHPAITTKNIPAGINRRLSSLSSDKTSFD